jgi:hypothetical protein
MASSSAADEWRAQKVELQQQRAVIEQLHAQMTVAWKENARLMDAARAKGRERASAGSHMQLALAHGSRAVGKLFYSSGSLPSAKRGGEAAATATTLDAAKVRAAGQQKLTRKSVNRRLGTSHQKRPTSDAQKQFAAMYVHEDKWMHDDSGVWIPKMPAKQRWDLVILVLILYSCIMVPYRIGMTADAEGAMWVFEVSVPARQCMRMPFARMPAHQRGRRGRAGGEGVLAARACWVHALVVATRGARARWTMDAALGRRVHGFTSALLLSLSHRYTSRSCSSPISPSTSTRPTSKGPTS